MTSVLREQHTVPKRSSISQSMPLPVRRPKGRGLRWRNSSAQPWPQPGRTPSAGRSIVSSAPPSIVAFGRHSKTSSGGGW